MALYFAINFNDRYEVDVKKFKVGDERILPFLKGNWRSCIYVKVDGEDRQHLKDRFPDLPQSCNTESITYPGDWAKFICLNY